MIPFMRLASLALPTAVLLLSACGTTSPATRSWEETEWDDSTACEDPDADECIAFACDGEEELCGVFTCEDVDPEAVVGSSSTPRTELARGGAYRPPMRGPVPFRNWRNMGVRQGARPRMTFHFRYNFGYLPAFPRYMGRVVKHHLFPQAQEFRQWFMRAGINVHEWTMLIPEHVHRQIHSGSGRGGMWNAAWRVFRDANPNPPSRDVMIRHALDLAFRYQLVGPLVPYNQPVMPIGPQLYQN
jgi:uncharacterized lipoprotein (TIGR02269 family)